MKLNTNFSNRIRCQNIMQKSNRSVPTSLCRFELGKNYVVKSILNKKKHIGKISLGKNTNGNVAIS